MAYCRITGMCHDLSGTRYGGNNVVYVWLDRDNKPFYVGSGSDQRATSVSGRDKRFRDRFDKYCAVAIVANGVQRLGGYAFEILLTDRLARMGFDLVNIAYNRGHDKQYSWIPPEIVAVYCKDFLEWVQGQHEAILEAK